MAERWAIYDDSAAPSAAIKRVVTVRGPSALAADVLAENLAAGEAAIAAPDDVDGQVYDDTHTIADPGGTPTLIRTHTYEYTEGGGPPDRNPV